jgi:hypothetical protein
MIVRATSEFGPSGVSTLTFGISVTHEGGH